MPMSKLHVFLSAAEIEALNTQLAARITHDYQDVLKPGEALHVIVTLKGAVFFAADLLRKIDLPVLVDFVRVSSYGNATQSSGVVKVIHDVETTPIGKHVLILDEIVDSGLTLSVLLDRLNALQPASLKICALLSKPSRRQTPVEIHYLGTEVEDKFLVGYGLDHGERYRNLKEISVLDSSP